MFVIPMDRPPYLSKRPASKVAGFLGEQHLNTGV